MKEARLWKKKGYIRTRFKVFWRELTSKRKIKGNYRKKLQLTRLTSNFFMKRTKQ